MNQLNLKMNKLALLVVVVIGTVLFFSACGSKSNGNKEDPAAAEKQNKEARNEANVKAVVKAIGNSDVRFPIFIDDEGNIGAIDTVVSVNDNGSMMVSESGDITHGFDNPETGISVYAFAGQNKLNEEQIRAIGDLISPMELFDIPEYYPDDFSGSFPYKGADIDYLTLSNVQTEPSDEDDNNLQITADLTVHLHLVDGTKETKVIEVATVPEIGNTPLNEEKVESALSADKMNEDLPNEKRSFYKEKGANSDE